MRREFFSVAESDATTGDVVVPEMRGDETQPRAMQDRGEIDFVSRPDVVPCFTPGAEIATIRGGVMVEDLRQGDMVITRDNGIRPIGWIGTKRLSATDLNRTPALQPVRIRAGALGRGLPLQDLVVSPNHRVLVHAPLLSAVSGENEILARAGQLVGLPGIEIAAAQEAIYIHFMFEQHEIVLSDGAWSESFQPAVDTIGCLDEAQREELLSLFPDLRKWSGLERYGAARPGLTDAQSAQLLAQTS